MRKAILLYVLFLSSVLCAEETKSFPLEVSVTRGNVTVQCSYVDMSNWPAIFRRASGFHCLVAISDPSISFIGVQIETKSGVKSERSSAQSGFSIVVFPTEDREILSLVVTQETRF